MEYSLFTDFEQINNLGNLSETQDFYTMLEELRKVALSADGTDWAMYPTFLDYAHICFWAIRKLEYSFAVQKMVAAEKVLGNNLRVLDVGCGVVPLNNWISHRGHRVIALDPLYSDISFLVRSDINILYKSEVEYLTSAGEALPFPDNYFDVVTSISVLEHTIPGNDRVILAEIARVLKPKGYFITTFDVIPQRPLAQGEASLTEGLRYFNYPFSPDAVLLMLKWLGRFFHVSTEKESKLLQQVQSLSWEKIRAFWKAAQKIDIREDSVRNYLALGLFLKKKESVSNVSAHNILAAYRDGQAALRQSLFYYQFHAHERLSQLQIRQNQIQILKEDIVEKDILINALNHILYKYRTSISYWWAQGAVQANAFGRLITKLLVPFVKLLQWIRRLFLPKIGVSRQHRPRELRFPASYHRNTCNESTEIPVISIVTPSYNQGIFIEQTIKSVIEQNYPKLEYVVIDGGSTDKTLEILAKYKDRLHYSVSQPDDGQTDAINKGFQHTSGEIMAYLNSDDLLVPGALYYVSDFFQTHPKVDALYGHRILIDENGEEIGRWIMPPHDSEVLRWADYLPQETLFWRRRLWERIGASFDTSFTFAMDWDLLVRFIAAGAEFIRLPRPLGIFRVHGAQKTTAQIDIGTLEMNRIRERIHGYIPSIEEIQKNIKPYLKKSVIYHYLYYLGIRK